MLTLTYGRCNIQQGIVKCLARITWLNHRKKKRKHCCNGKYQPENVIWWFGHFFLMHWEKVPKTFWQKQCLHPSLLPQVLFDLHECSSEKKRVKHKNHFQLLTILSAFLSAQWIFWLGENSSLIQQCLVLGKVTGAKQFFLYFCSSCFWCWQVQISFSFGLGDRKG